MLNVALYPSKPNLNLSLCSGIGGLDLAIRLFSPGTRTALYVEREAYCASVLVARMEDEALCKAPIHSDIFSLDPESMAGVVDFVSGGFPCPPVSCSGKQLGNMDDRWLWPEFFRCILNIRPRYVFLENVAGLVSNHKSQEFKEVLGDLSSLGYDAVWGVFSCGEMGANHLRRRVFILAWDPKQIELRPYSKLPGTRRTESEDRAKDTESSQKREKLESNSSSFNIWFEQGVRGESEDTSVSRNISQNEIRSNSNCLNKRINRNRWEIREWLFKAWWGVTQMESNSLCSEHQILQEQSDPQLPSPSRSNPSSISPSCFPTIWAPRLESNFSSIHPDLWPRRPRRPSKLCICREHDGLPLKLEQCEGPTTERLRALGNAVSPIQGAMALHVLWQRMTQMIRGY